MQKNGRALRAPPALVAFCVPGKPASQYGTSPVGFGLPCLFLVLGACGPSIISAFLGHASIDHLSLNPFFAALHLFPHFPLFRLPRGQSLCTPTRPRRRTFLLPSRHQASKPASPSLHDRITSPVWVPSATTLVTRAKGCWPSNSIPHNICSCRSNSPGISGDTNTRPLP